MEDSSSSSSVNQPLLTEHRRRRAHHASDEHHKQTLVVNAQHAAGHLVDIPEETTTSGGQPTNIIMSRKTSDASTVSSTSEEVGCFDRRSRFMSNVRFAIQAIAFLVLALGFIVLIVYVAKNTGFRTPGAGGRHNRRHRHRHRLLGNQTDPDLNVTSSDDDFVREVKPKKGHHRNLNSVSLGAANIAYVTYVYEWDQFHSAVFLGCSLIQTGTAFDMIMLIDADSVLPKKSKWQIGGWLSPKTDDAEKKLDKLAQSLESHPEELSIAQACGWRLEFVSESEIHKKGTGWNSDHAQFGLLKVFNLTSYDKIVYMEPTSLVFRNIDFVSDCPGAFCALNLEAQLSDNSLGALKFQRAPVLVITPSLDLFNAMLAHIQLLGSPSVDSFLRNYMFYYCKSDLVPKMGVPVPDNSPSTLILCPQDDSASQQFKCKCWSLSDVLNSSDADNIRSLQAGMDPRMVHVVHFKELKPWEWRNYPLNGWLVLWDQYAAQFPGAFQHYHIDDSLWNWFWLLSPCGPTIFIFGFIILSRVLLRRLIFPFSAFHPLIQWLGFRGSNLYSFILLLCSIPTCLAFVIAYATGLIVPRSVFPVHHAIWAICFVAFSIICSVTGSYLVFCYDAGLLLHMKAGYYSTHYDRSTATWQRVYESLGLAVLLLCGGFFFVFKTLYWFRWHPGLPRISFLLLTILTSICGFALSIRRCSSVLYVLGASAQLVISTNSSSPVEVMLSDLNPSPRKRKSVKTK
jgi:hypothetical protein